MMTIEIEDSTYELLLRQIKRFNETPNDVIRRLTGASKEIPKNGHSAQNSSASNVSKNQTTPLRTIQDPIMAFLNGPSFLVQGNAIGKFLSVLSWLCNQHPSKFEKVQLLNGRKRKYFARTEQELDASGSSVMPKRIPNTPYWVISNSSNQLKKQLIADVMRMLGYDSLAIQTVAEAIR